MNPVSVAGRYARALFELAREGDAKKLPAIAAELSLAAAILGSDQQVMSFFKSAVKGTETDALLETLGEKARLSDLTRRFLAVLAENRRLPELRAIAAAFEEMKDEALGIVPAEATVAVKMGETQVSALRAALEKMIGREVRLSVKVDPAVLGGARTRVGSRLYDGTLRSRLEALHRRMAGAS